MNVYRVVALLLIGLLTLVPPSGATCLPLPNGQRLHIGWVNGQRHETQALTVFTHSAHAHIAVAAPQAVLTPASTVTLPAGGDFMPPLLEVGWPPLIFIAGVYWTRRLNPFFPNLPPPTPPPRRAASA
jgi:hypothetical protein